MMTEPEESQNSIIIGIHQEKNWTLWYLPFYIISLCQSFCILEKIHIRLLKENPWSPCGFSPLLDNLFPLPFVRDVWFDELEHGKNKKHTKINFMRFGSFYRKVPPRLVLDCTLWREFPGSSNQRESWIVFRESQDWIPTIYHLRFTIYDFLLPASRVLTAQVLLIHL